MRDKQGTNVHDYSRYGNDGALTGCKWVEHGLEFNGTSDYVDCGNDANLNITNEITISVMVKGTGQKVDYAGLIEKNAQNSGYLLRVSDNKVKFFIRNTGDTPSYGLIIADNILPVYVWTHCIAVRDNSNKMMLYINGIKQANTATFVSTIDPSANNLIIGEYNSDFFKGSISDVRIYNYALNASEIKQYYESTKHKYI